MDEQIRRMKKYLRPRILSRELTLLIPSVLIVCITVLYFVCGIIIYFETGFFPSDMWGFLIVLLCLVVFCFFEGIYKSVKFRIQLRKWESSEEIYHIIKDFERAIPMYDGRIMMGTKYAFGKNCSVAIAYTDIDRVYEYVHTTNVIRDLRILRVRMINRNTHDLCYLKVYRKKPSEEMAIIQTILEHNPSVKVGAR